MHESTMSPSIGADTPTAPPWVGDLLGREAVAHEPQTRGRTVLNVCETAQWSLASVRVPEAAALDRLGFQRVTAEAYRQLRVGLDRCAANQPVRIWNYIPAIRRRYTVDLDQYMAFNAGRYAAFASPGWYGQICRAEASMPTASAVGHDGEDLVLHALACDRPGRPVENPRQVSAYHYSRRYGPRPPCFARATVIQDAHGASRILVGGTASVIGEDSRHEDDLIAQARETFENLGHLTRAAGFQASHPSGGRCVGGDPSGQAAHHAFTALRVYYVRPEDLPTLRGLVAGCFPQAKIEWLRADLCRPELLVEIEGVADMGSRVIP
jgi:chorismate lyase / 3-hydroxybenzoate synthase